MSSGLKTESHLKDLMVTLGHQFEDIELLNLSLTHSSLIGEDKLHTVSNERLEFVGDRVLGLIVAELLLERFPEENEGDLSRRHAALVRMKTLGHVATSLNLGKFIHMSRGEERMGGRKHPALLADTCEAIIAALYIDGGLNAATSFIKKNWLPLIESTSLPPKDAKTTLQEWAQKLGLPVPIYREIERNGPAHEPVFTVVVEVMGHEQFTGCGLSKRAAEQQAAENMLKTVTCAKN